MLRDVGQKSNLTPERWFELTMVGNKWNGEILK